MELERERESAKREKKHLMARLRGRRVCVCARGRVHFKLFPNESCILNVFFFVLVIGYLNTLKNVQHCEAIANVSEREVVNRRVCARKKRMESYCEWCNCVFPK